MSPQIDDRTRTPARGCTIASGRREIGP